MKVTFGSITFVCGLGHLYYWKFWRLRRARDVEMYDVSTPPRFDEIRKY